jgi:hypothetical protein
MNRLAGEAAAFRQRKRELVSAARVRVALALLLGIDPEEAEAADPSRRERLALRARRLLERERQRGLTRHWSYDLNRHIALKQALDLLTGQKEAAPNRRRSLDTRKRYSGGN